MLLEQLRKRFEKRLVLEIERFGEKNRLRDACEYALMCGGKRLRPLIVLMVAEALPHGLDVFPAALGVEFFHTASLIADDLPCMDDDSVRRGRASLHRAFDEATAILASYTLIAEGYGGIYLNGQKMQKHPSFAKKAGEVVLLCLEAATRCGGIQGATNGQFLDLFPPDTSWETVEKVILQKTVTLFEVSFLFGWLFGGGSFESINRLRQAAFHLGMAFQIADDIDDQEHDQKAGINIVSILGKEKAISLFQKEIALLRAALEELHLWTEPFQELYSLLGRRCCIPDRLFR